MDGTLNVLANHFSDLLSTLIMEPLIKKLTYVHLVVCPITKKTKGLISDLSVILYMQFENGNLEKLTYIFLKQSQFLSLKKYFRCGNKPLLLPHDKMSGEKCKTLDWFVAENEKLRLGTRMWLALAFLKLTAV